MEKKFTRSKKSCPGVQRGEGFKKSQDFFRSILGVSSVFP